MTFRDLHDGALPLLLPNAWDVASALAFVSAGFAAVGTTSFGVSAALGVPDGRAATRDASRALAHALSTLPAFVSVDIEDGYSADPGEVADYVASLGVAGVNVEDSTDGRLVEPAAHAEKIAEIKDRNPAVYVNARTDTYWLGQDATLSATLERAAAYVSAGADGIFVPGATKPAELRELAVNLPVPVNVLVIPELSLPHLADLGIRRVSTGSLPYRAALDAAVAVATAVRDGQAPPAATSYAEAQDRLIRYAADR
ncbi:2-Methylisocitrate lyase, PEP mutase family [Asanoa hainanensis]|uniref:2-Methylisocitrate lyase, PEP mutase family n=1 Tax=Asanoa hainanensis TaxID=560556 RepID=A0A239GUX9_9ACTN|nr:isocitrate lyase/phosphoenolpyruvate mutase family protein [Asanoa hainanensis]SNS72781.1 2-Methylisocitrate lyase, PEP mutase family [Asanoa hainanensis]